MEKNVIKLGSIMPAVFSDDGRYYLSYHLYGSGRASLVNMRTGEMAQLDLPKSITACSISSHGNKICAMDVKGYIYITDTKSLKTERITNLFSEFNINKDCIAMEMYFLNNFKKVLTFIYYPPDNDANEYLYVVITDTETKKSDMLFKFDKCCFLSVENKGEEFILFIIQRESKSEGKYGFIKFNPLSMDKDVCFESYENYCNFEWYLTTLSRCIFDRFSKYFYAVKITEYPRIDYKNLYIFDYKTKNMITSKNAVWENGTFNSLTWLPVENLFLCKFKESDNYFVCDIKSKSAVAEISFKGYDIIITMYYSDEVPVSAVLASKRDFGFTSKSKPIKNIYMSSNNKYIVYDNGQKAYAQDISVLLEFFKRS